MSTKAGSLQKELAVEDLSSYGPISRKVSDQLHNVQKRYDRIVEMKCPD